MPAVSHPDRDCLQKIQARDRAACEAFVDAHYRGIHRFFVWLVRDADAAADLTQETFLSFWDSAARLDPEAAPDLKTWLYGIARNRWRKWCRAGSGPGPRAWERWEPPFGSGEEADAGAEIESGAPGPEELALASLERERVEAALASLPPEYREALVLRVFEELDYEQIAQVLQIGAGLARWRVHQARQRLRRRLMPDPARV
jgi:RNA polymerase sigma-70 factor (ECF subfamily)